VLHEVTETHEKTSTPPPGCFGIKEHTLLASSLKDSSAKFLVSYNDHELIRELYKDFNIKETKEIEYTLGKNAHGVAKKVREIYITNYELKENLFS